jgi:hypothetical protein
MEKNGSMIIGILKIGRMRHLCRCGNKKSHPHRTTCGVGIIF